MAVHGAMHYQPACGNAKPGRSIEIWNRVMGGQNGERGRLGSKRQEVVAPRVGNLHWNLSLWRSWHAYLLGLALAVKELMRLVREYIFPYLSQTSQSASPHKMEHKTLLSPTWPTPDCLNFFQQISTEIVKWFSLLVSDESLLLLCRDMKLMFSKRISRDWFAANPIRMGFASQNFTFI